MTRRHVSFDLWLPDLPGHWRAWLPNRGNALFTLLLIVGLLWAQSAGALPLGRPQAAPAAASTGAIAYQGRLADANGNPLTGTYNMIFRLYAAPTGGAPLWEEQWTGSNGVRVSDGLFNVMLGSLTPIQQSVIAGHDQLWLGITVGTDDEMQPRVQLGSVPWAMGTRTLLDGTESLGSLAVNGLFTVKNNVGPTVRLQTTNDRNITLLELNHPDLDWHFHVDAGNHAEMGVYDKAAQAWRWNVMDIDRATGNVGMGADASSDTRLKVYGNFTATGTKAATVHTRRFGQRKLYAAESPEVRFFDEGLAHLENGVARVDLDPIFLETIEGDYLVHVTPYGDASLYVAEVGKDYFVVRAREGDPNIAFAWRLSAHRKGYAGVRLEEIR
jgi:hypothetical protein